MNVLMLIQFYRSFFQIHPKECHTIRINNERNRIEWIITSHFDLENTNVYI
jgi:hypothetical protein